MGESLSSVFGKEIRKHMIKNDKDFIRGMEIGRRQGRLIVLKDLKLNFEEIIKNAEEEICEIEDELADTLKEMQ